MTSTRASISKASKRPKINIIPPKQLFVDLTQDDTKTPSPKLQLSSPSAPNAPSKTPSTKDTSSSSIDYIPKSPTSSTSLSPNAAAARKQSFAPLSAKKVLRSIKFRKEAKETKKRSPGVVTLAVRSRKSRF
ncbi:hypothetical protein Tco_0268226 [Tanacetum coccineum]